MFEAQYLFNGDVVYSPWFAREGDNLQITVDVVSVDLNTGLKVEMYTKNKEDTGVPATGNPLSPADSDISATTAGVKTAQYLSSGTSAAKELVRYKFTASGTGDQKALFRVLPIIWWDDVDA